MLQRAAETVSGDDECNDPAVLLACALGSTGCPAKCAEEEGQKSTINPYEGVQAGDLNVAVSTSTSVTSIPNSGVIKVAELAVKASENIQLQSVDITRLGLSQNAGIKVWIEKDGKRISSSSSIQGDGKASLTFNNNGYVVNGDETLDLVISLDSSKQLAGGELQFKVSNLVSSAKSSSISPDTTGIFRTTTYNATSISVTQNATERSYDLAEDTTFSFGEFKVLNDSKASDERNVLIRNITFKVTGNDIENLSNFKLLRDSKEVSSKYTVDGKSLTFTVNDQLDSGKSATYKVTAVPTNIESAKSSDEYTLTIRKAEDIVAEEIGSNASAYRVSVYTDTAAKEWSEVSLGLTKIKGGNFTLTRDANFTSTVNASWGYTDVVVAKGTFKANQAVKYENGIEIEKDNLYDGTTPVTTGLDVVLRRATLKIGNRTYQATIEAGKLDFTSEVYIDKGTHDVELTVSLVNNTPSVAVTSIKLKNIEASTFGTGNYINSDETEAGENQIAGSIRVATINIADQKMGLKKNGPSDDVKVVAGNTDERVLLEGTISNTTDKELSINSFTITGVNLTGATLSGGKAKFADVYVKLGDKTSSRVSFSALSGLNGKYNTAEKQSIDLSATIAKGESVNFTVYAMPNANLKADDQFRFEVSVEGKADGNTVSSSPLTSAYVKVRGQADTSAIASTAKSKIIFPGVSTEIASFEYTVKNDNVEVGGFEVAGLNASDISDLTIDFGGSVGTPALSYVAGTSKTVATFNNRLSIPEGKYNVRVLATFDEDAVDSNARAISSIQFVDGTNNVGSAIDLGSNNKHYIAKAYPVLTRESYSSDKDAPSLEIGLTKTVKDGTSAKVIITALSGYYKSGDAQKPDDKIIWSPALSTYFFNGTDNLDMSNISTSKEILKSSYAKIHVTGISFAVEEDGKTTYYSGLTVNSIADFSRLTNE